MELHKVDGDYQVIAKIWRIVGLLFQVMIIAYHAIKAPIQTLLKTQFSLSNYLVLTVLSRTVIVWYVSLTIYRCWTAYHDLYRLIEVHRPRLAHSVTKSIPGEGLSWNGCKALAIVGSPFASLLIPTMIGTFKQETLLRRYTFSYSCIDCHQLLSNKLCSIIRIVTAGTAVQTHSHC